MKTKQDESSVVVFAGEEPVCKLLESGSDKELDSPSLKKKNLLTSWYQAEKTVSKILIYKNGQKANCFIPLSLW